jgi:hypothetical protein
MFKAHEEMCQISQMNKKNGDAHMHKKFQNKISNQSLTVRRFAKLSRDGFVITSTKTPAPYQEFELSK